MSERQISADMAKLMELPEFRRFLFRVIQMARIFEPVTDGADSRHLLHEGRRQLGLEILADAETGQPVTHPDRIPILTAIQVLREEAQQTISETVRDKPYRRTAELNTDPADAD